MPAIPTQIIQLAKNRKATAYFPTGEDTGQELAAQMSLGNYKGVVIVIGGADSLAPESQPALKQLFDRGIARSAVNANTIILDGGTAAGVMALMGQGVESRGRKSPLVGVAPRGRVTYPGQPKEERPSDGAALEENHTHFILTEGDEWGSETEWLFSLAVALTQPPAKDGGRTQKLQAVAVLIGGGEVAREEAVQAVRHNFPLLVVKGSGGFADELSAAYENRDTVPADVATAEIIADGALHFHTLGNPVQGMERLIIRELGTDKVLGQAWETFARYDRNANLQQKYFSKLQLWILLLGVVGTALAITSEVLPRNFDTMNRIPLQGSLRIILIIIPIVLTVLITFSNRFKQGNKWLLLRAGAESIKREIYRYRVKGYYRDNPEQQLAQKVEDVTRRTMRTEVNTTSLQPYEGTTYPPQMDESLGADDGFSFLQPDRYVEIRLGDQLNYFQNKAVKLERQLKFYSVSIFVAGGLGTFLAAINYPVWIALTTAVGAAFGTYLGFRQTENTLTKYNQAATDLSNVKAWWNALSAAEQARQENINALVDHTEQVLQTELDGWVQQMQDALAELRKNQDAIIQKKEEKREPGTGDPTTETIERTGKRPVQTGVANQKGELPPSPVDLPSNGNGKADAPLAQTPPPAGGSSDGMGQMPQGEVTEADLAGADGSEVTAPGEEGSDADGAAADGAEDPVKEAKG